MSEERRNLYLILFDGQEYYVEAHSMSCAIEAWKAHVQVEWGSDWDGTEEPDSCALVHDEAVIRAKALGFEDALRIARGCTDYGGGYRNDEEKMSAFQHGIKTVINALESAARLGFADSQVTVLHAIGKGAE